jgi:renalase
MDVDVAVVGAGLSGLVAARTLTRQGRRVRVLEQRAEPGGRLATRRLGNATLDHGAQFFTSRTPEFARLVDEWRVNGSGIGTWCHGFARAASVLDGPESAVLHPDGHPRFFVRGGMQSLARDLARDLPVDLGAQVTVLEPRLHGWRVHVRRGSDVAAVDAAAVVLTVPGPASRPLLDPLGVAVSLPAFEPAVALLAVLDRTPGLPDPGGVQFTDGPVSWLADNAAKGISASPAVTVHAAGPESEALLDVSDDTASDRLWSFVGPWCGAARPVVTAVERWPSARPVDVHEQRALRFTVDGAPLVLAGDAYRGPRIEGAALSGLAAAGLC